jgi:protein-tyrosine phosphatase
MMKIYKIAPGLLQSARTHQLTDAELNELIARYNITGVINLWHTPDQRVIDQVGWYEHASMPDGQLTETAGKLVSMLAERAVAEIQDGGTVLVHCWGGRNRSGLVSALALRRLQGITGAEAVKAVKAVRAGALVNQYFVDYLEKRL